MQQLLPLAFWAILPTSIRGILALLCMFFNVICKKFVDPQVLDDLENETIVSIGNVFSTLIFWYHGSFDSSSSEGNSIMWVSFLEMDVLKGEIHEDLKGICQESISIRNINYRAIHCRRSHWILLICQVVNQLEFLRLDLKVNVKVRVCVDSNSVWVDSNSVWGQMTSTSLLWILTRWVI